MCIRDRSMHGLHVNGFPNLFIVGPSQGANLISNITHNLTEAGTTIAVTVAHAIEMGADCVEVTEAAEQAWVRLLESSSRGFLGNPDCTPGYYNNAVSYTHLDVYKRQPLTHGRSRRSRSA